MKQFTVIVTRALTESVVLTIDAKDLYAAQDTAMKMVSADTGQLGWEIDDNTPGEAYVSDMWEE